MGTVMEAQSGSLGHDESVEHDMSVGQYGTQGSILRVELTVTKEKDVAKLLSILRPVWKRRDIVLWTLSNSTYSGYCPPLPGMSPVSTSLSPCSILASTWAGYDVKNPNQKLRVEIFSSPCETHAQSSIHQLLSSADLSSKLVGVCSNGLVTQYEPPLNPREHHWIVSSPRLAETVGAMHRTLTPPSHLVPSVNVFEQIAVWLQQGLHSQGGEEGEDPPHTPRLEELVGELSHLEEEITKVGQMEV